MSANEDIDISEAIRVAISAVEREDYDGALRLFREIYGKPDREAPVDGLSHYGLCIAIAEKQANKGALLCEEAIEAQFYDSTHHVNLIKIHLKKGSRRRAIRALTRGLKRIPGDAELEQLRLQIGHRSGGVIPFLDRDNWLNKKLGPLLRGRRKPDKSVEEQHSENAPKISSLIESDFGRILIVIVAFGIIFGVTFLVLYHQAFK